MRGCPHAATGASACANREQPGATPCDPRRTSVYAVPETPRVRAAVLTPQISAVRDADSGRLRVAAADSRQKTPICRDLCRRRDSNPRHADYDYGSRIAGKIT